MSSPSLPGRAPKSVTLLSALLLCAGQVVAAQPKLSSCAPQEDVAFSCSIGTKRLSVCVDAARRVLRYQFGKPGQVPELEVASRRGDLKPSIQVEATTSFMDGTHSSVYEILVVNGDTQYQIAVPEVLDETSMPGVSVAVLMPKKKPVLLSCAPHSETANVDILESIKRGK